MPEISLGESIDISRVGIVYDELKASLQTSSPISLDISNLTQIDGAGVQLLYAFISAARKQGLDISVSEPSVNLKSAAELLGLDHLMGFSV